MTKNTNFIKGSSVDIALQIDDLISLHQRQIQKFHAFKKAWEKWKLECSSKKWWQSKPHCPSVEDYFYD